MQNTQYDQTLFRTNKEKADAVKADRLKMKEAKKQREEQKKRAANELRENRRRRKEELERWRAIELQANKEIVAAERGKKIEGKKQIEEELKRKIMEIDMRWKEEEKLRAESMAREKTRDLLEKKKTEELRNRALQMRRESDIRYRGMTQRMGTIIGYDYSQRRGSGMEEVREEAERRIEEREIREIEVEEGGAEIRRDEEVTSSQASIVSIRNIILLT